MGHAPHRPTGCTLAAPHRRHASANHRRPHAWLAIAAGVLSGACSSTDYRGRDESVLFTSLRARMAVPSRRDDPASRRVRFRTDVGAEWLHVRGDYAADADHPRYAATALSFLFEPMLRWRGFELRGLLGPSYLVGEVEGSTGTLNSRGFGVAGGLGCSCEVGEHFEPYVRFVQASSSETTIGRFEGGVFTWLTPQLGASVAYGRQTSRVYDDSLFSGRAAHITSEGVAIGMILRL